MRLSVTRPSAVAVTDTTTRGRLRPSGPGGWSPGMELTVTPSPDTRSPRSGAVLPPGELQEHVLERGTGHPQAGERAVPGEPSEDDVRLAGGDGQRHPVVGHRVCGPGAAQAP